MKLEREFYSKDTKEVAREILGKILVHKTEGGTLKGKIVEVEAYLGLMTLALSDLEEQKTFLKHC